MAELKDYFRNVLSETRRSMQGPQVAELSSRIQQRLLHSPLWQSAGAVVLYAASANEVATDSLFAAALESGRAVFFPRLDRTSNRTELALVRAASDLSPGAFGILEPPGVAPSVQPHAASALFVVPGVVFTRIGARIGRGGGHYDRLISSLKPALRVGLAFSFQLLDSIPQDESDQPMNFIITESSVHECGNYPERPAFRPEAGGLA